MSTRRPSDQRGSNSVEAAIVVPVFLMIILLVIQVGAYAHAKNVAHSAASTAYNEARLENAAGAGGQQAAHQVISKNSGSLRDASVQVSRSATQVTVTVSGRGPSLVPFWHGPTIHQEISGPTERWINR